MIVGPVFSISRSAASGVATVVGAAAVLLARTGSCSAAVADAVVVNTPGTVVAASTVTVAALPGASVPRLQVVTAHVPWLGAADRNVSSGGSVAVSVTPVAAAGPAFLTVIVYEASVPAAT